MKKLYLASALATVLTLSSNAMAIDSTGCGLGSMAWRGQSGTAPQILAVTTIGSFGTQTFGISSGTSGCDQNGRITGGTQRMVLNFLENNMEQYALDASRGEGETLDTLAGIMEVDKSELAAKVHDNFAFIFPNDNVDADEVTLNLFKVMNAKFPDAETLCRKGGRLFSSYVYAKGQNKKICERAAGGGDVVCVGPSRR